MVYKVSLLTLRSLRGIRNRVWTQMYTTRELLVVERVVERHTCKIYRRKQCHWYPGIFFLWYLISPNF